MSLAYKEGESMEKFDKRCQGLEFQWFSVFKITNKDGKKSLMAMWGNKDDVPLVTRLRVENEGGSIEKYCVGMARSYEERDAIVKNMTAVAENRGWEDD